MNEIGKILHQGLRDTIASFCLTKATLDINGAGAATIKNTGTTTYLVDGVFKTKVALSAQSIAPTHDQLGNPVSSANPAYVQPAAKTAIYVVALNAGGTVAIVQGGYAGQEYQNVFNKEERVTSTGACPPLPAGYVAIGALKVATGASTTFTPGTTLLDAAGITVTYFDLAFLPETL